MPALTQSFSLFMLRLRLPLLLFFLVTLLVYATAVYVVGIIAQTPKPDVLAAALTFDLVVLVPLLFYGLVVRWQGWSWITVVPVFVGSMLVAHQLIPADHQAALHLLGYLAAPIELLVLGVLGHRAYRIAQQLRTRSANADLLEAMMAGVREVIPVPWAANVVAYELSVFAYALTGWRRATPQGAPCFSSHRRSSYGVVVTAILVAACVEMVAVHVLVQQWSAVAAWVLTGLSAYGMLWGLAEIQAARLRPITVGSEGVVVRSGLRWTIHVPFSAIDAVWRAHEYPLPRKTTHLLNVTPLGAPQYLLTLTEPVVAHGLYGYQKTISRLQFAVDAPDAFEASLAQAFEAWKSAAA